MAGVALVPLFVASHPVMANECGPVPGGSPLVCNAASYPTGVSYLNADGLANGLTLQVDTIALVIAVSNARGVVIESGTGATGDLAIDAVNFNSITTSGGFERAGLAVLNRETGGTNDATVTLRNGSITTSGGGGHGLQSTVLGSGEARIVMQGGSVRTTGQFASGGRATSQGNGGATVMMHGGSIETTDGTNAGLFARLRAVGGTGAGTGIMTGGSIDTMGEGLRVIHETGHAGNGQISVSGGSITTRGAGAEAVQGAHSGTGSMAIDISGGTITALGSGASAVLAAIANGASASAVAITVSGGTLLNAGDNADGVKVENAGAGAGSIAMTGGSVATAGDDSAGLHAEARGTGETGITVSGGSVSTAGDDSPVAHAFATATSTGAARITVSGGTGGTIGTDAHGLMAEVANGASAASASVTVDGGTLSTAGSGAHAVFAANAGAGLATASLLRGTLSTTGESAYGVQALATGTGAAHVDMTGGSLSTAGDGAHGASVVASGSGAVEATVAGGAIATTGDGAVGLHLSGERADAAAAVAATVSGGAIETSGAAGHGVAVVNAGLGETSVAMTGGAVRTSGTAAHGIAIGSLDTDAAAALSIRLEGGAVRASGDGLHIVGAGTGARTVEITGGTVTGGGGDHAAIRLGGPGRGTVTILADGVVDGAASGVAIRVGDGLADLDLDGVADETVGAAGPVTVTTAGTVRGDALLGSGDDTFQLAGGSYTGDVFGAAGDDSFVWSAGDLNSGFYGGDGADVLWIGPDAGYEGTEVMDGGDDLSLADGFLDRLTIDGQTVSLTGSTLRNFEIIALNGTDLAVTDGLVSAGTDLGTGVLLVDGAVLRAGDGLTVAANLELADGTRLIGAGGGGGTFAVLGSLTNDGTITLTDDRPGDRLVVAGDYRGDGTVELDLDLHTGTADRIAIGGGHAGGTTRIVVNDVSTGFGNGLAIRLVELGDTTGGGDFQIVAPRRSGAFTYAPIVVDGEIILQAGLAPSMPAYEAYPRHLLALGGGVDRFEPDRLGRRDDGATDGRMAMAGDGAGLAQAVWARVEGGRSRLDARASETGSDLTTDRRTMRIGIDGLLHETGAGVLMAGVSGFGVSGQTRVQSALGDAVLSGMGHGVAASLSWLGANGVQADIRGQAGLTATTLTAVEGGVLATDTAARVFAAAAEVGRRFEAAGVSLTPRAGLAWASVDADPFDADAGGTVSVSRGESLTARIELAFARVTEVATPTRPLRARLHGRLAIARQLLGTTEVQVVGTGLSNTPGPLTGELDLGFSLGDPDGRMQAFGEIGFAGDLINIGATYAVMGRAGVRLLF
ncbi:hypothetical protein [Mongoliimonas terrestris]|uniref:hypothetical protein n=1 Tax=Mongoliimonas terrestris TaxID=1709001 RepID=UPI000949AE15|nr:hypothetical protein [Mongoliimonas terrestris]